MNIRKVLLAFIFIVLVLSSCSKDINQNMSESVPEFSFKTQDNEKLNLDDLHGEWWITYMSYTECATVCPRTTENMIDIQKELKSYNLHPQIISFNVDPDNDDLEDIKSYAEEYDIDLDSWDFLSGYDFKTIQQFSENTFNATLEKGATNQVSHSYMFYLVNPKGEVVKKYNGMGQTDLDMLVSDMITVLN